MNNLAPMKNCPGGMQGNLNWMRGYEINAIWRLTLRHVFTGSLELNCLCENIAFVLNNNYK